VVGTTKSATFQQDACGHWFVTLVAEREVPDIMLVESARADGEPLPAPQTYDCRYTATGSS
jgi:hypothetical protein